MTALMTSSIPTPLHATGNPACRSRSTEPGLRVDASPKHPPTAAIPHCILLIHGIGVERHGFNRGLGKRIRKTFAKTIRNLGQKHPYGGLQVREVVWSGITQHDQHHLWQRLFPDRPPTADDGASLRWGTWLRRLSYWASFRKLILSYIGDPISYVPGWSKYQRIHDEVLTAIEGFQHPAPSEPILLTIVAHSLGSVIASDLLAGLRTPNTRRRWPAGVALANFITVGSPLALYVLRHELRQASAPTPVQLHDPHGVWINVYDPQDILAYPLKQLNRAYDESILADLEINAGQRWNPLHRLMQMTPLSHFLYWFDHTVADLVGRKAALDWLRSNNRIPFPELSRHYENYKAWIRAQ